MRAAPGPPRDRAIPADRIPHEPGFGSAEQIRSELHTSAYHVPSRAGTTAHVRRHATALDVSREDAAPTFTPKRSSPIRACLHQRVASEVDLLTNLLVEPSSISTGGKIEPSGMMSGSLARSTMLQRSSPLGRGLSPAQREIRTSGSCISLAFQDGCAPRACGPECSALRSRPEFRRQPHRGTRIRASPLPRETAMTPGQCSTKPNDTCAPNWSAVPSRSAGRRHGAGPCRDRSRQAGTLTSTSSGRR